MYQSNQARNYHICSASQREPGDLTLAAAPAPSLSLSHARRRPSGGDHVLLHTNLPPSRTNYALDLVEP